MRVTKIKTQPMFHTQFMYPRAILDKDKVLYPYQYTPTSKIKIKHFRYSDMAELGDYDVATDPIPSDSHGTPAIIKYKGYYVSCYGEHSGVGVLKIAYSTDGIAWTDYSFPFTSPMFTYPQFFVLGNTLFLYLRETLSAIHARGNIYKTIDPTVSTSWQSVYTPLIDAGSGYAVYANVSYNGKRACIGWRNYTYGGYPVDKATYFIWTENGTTWYDKNGTVVTIPVDIAGLIKDWSPQKGDVNRMIMIGDCIYGITGIFDTSDVYLTYKKLSDTDFSHRLLTELTGDGGNFNNGSMPIYLPDGKLLVFGSRRVDSNNIMRWIEIATDFTETVLWDEGINRTQGSYPTTVMGQRYMTSTHYKPPDPPTDTFPEPVTGVFANRDVVISVVCEKLQPQVGEPYAVWVRVTYEGAPKENEPVILYENDVEVARGLTDSSGEFMYITSKSTPQVVRYKGRLGELG